MKKTLLALGLSIACLAPAADKDGWISLFDGKSLAGWKANEAPDTFKVENGELIVKGPRAHLFYVGDVQGAKFKNFELKLDISSSPVSIAVLWRSNSSRAPGPPAVRLNSTAYAAKKLENITMSEMRNIQNP